MGRDVAEHIHKYIYKRINKLNQRFYIKKLRKNRISSCLDNNYLIKIGKANRSKLIKNNVYNPEADEHSSCGVGLIASIFWHTIKKKLLRWVFRLLRVLYHRGAVDADGKDG